MIIQEYIPQYRQEFFKRLVASAAELGIDVKVAAGEPQGFMADRNDSVKDAFTISIYQREFSVLGKRLVLRNAWNHTKTADLVILEQARRNLDSYRLLLPRFLRRHAVALWGHGRDYVRSPNFVESRLSRILTNRSDWFFAYTQGGSNSVVSNGYNPRRVTILNNTIDSDRIETDLAEISSGNLLEFCSIHDLHENTAIFIGGLDESKRILFLLEAAERVHAHNEQFRLLIVGSGKLEPIVVGYAETHSWVTFFGPLQGVDKATALKASQVIVMPGRVGLIAVDSFAAGRPIITTDWRWHAPEFEYLVPDENAVVTSDSIEEYSDGINAVLNDKSLLGKLQHGALETRSLLSLDAMVARYLSGIKGALNLSEDCS